MRTKKLIKEFAFTDDVRSRLTISANARLNPDINCLTLKEDGDGFYPITGEHTVKTWVAHPTCLRQWLLFEAEDEHVDVDGVIVTSLFYRLAVGTSDYWVWTGTVWAKNPASPNDWNTEAQICAGLPSFSDAGQRLQLVIKLQTTDKRYTPKLYRAKMLYTGSIEFQEDYLYRSLIPLLKNNLRPISDFPIELAATTTTVNLAVDYKLKTPYNIKDVDAVFNHTDDPTHRTNILSSYNPTTQIITLNQSVDHGKKLWIQFIWEPEVAVTTSQDYTEVKKVPCVILQDTGLIDAAPRAHDETAINRSTGVGWLIPPPIQGDLSITAVLITDKATDQARLADEFKRLFLNNPQMNSVGLDEVFRLWLVQEYQMATSPNAADLTTGRLSFKLMGALFYLREPRICYGVKQLKTTDDSNLVIGR